MDNHDELPEFSLQVGARKIATKDPYWRHSRHLIEVAEVIDLGDGSADVLWHCVDCIDAPNWQVAVALT
jgi:hypothetical protein